MNTMVKVWRDSYLAGFFIIYTIYLIILFLIYHIYILLCKAIHSMHILLNPISVTDYRIQDKYQTYQDIVNYLNQYTHTLLLIYT